VEKRILTVLRSGGEYEPKHVQAVQRQVARWAPGVSFGCLSDTPIEGVDCIPLRHNWPGWFAKLELFRPDLGGRFLYTDLDNLIVGPLDDILEQRRYTTQVKGWNALMYVPRWTHEWAYEMFATNLEKAMQECAPEKFGEGQPFGDAAFAARYFESTAAHWETALPGQVVNIADLRRPWPWFWDPPPPDARVLLFGGSRRPWKLQRFARLYWGEAL
jgi:hypothetical protein